ncbi:site-specific DNA-methyltransferase [Candidatus Babeliales bacterium]|nr:site-specific DNA-methyltransferase [Candidatus Babeliales bacterium]
MLKRKDFIINTIKIDPNKKYTLIHGDTLEILPQFEPNLFDAVIADPPYASGSTTMKGRMMDTAKSTPITKSIAYFPTSKETSKTSYHGYYGRLCGWVCARKFSSQVAYLHSL